LFDLSCDALEHKLARFYKGFGVKVSSHDFRKTKATNLYRQDGESIASISMYLGHSSIATTQGYI
jgi:integrase